jgi:4-alpha-glucanotransferase
VKLFNFSVRSSGILLHLTSLPGELGSGDLGPDAHKFIEVLEKAGQSWWQMLPVGPPGSAPAFSPYDSGSGFAGSPYFVSLSLLEQEGLLEPDEIKRKKEYSKSRVNLNEVHKYREERLRLAFNNFLGLQGKKERGFKHFCNHNSSWLDDFALFMALKYDSGGKPWTEWQADLRARQTEALLSARHRLADEIDYHRFIQFKFDQQWRSLREKSHHHGIGLIGDLPIFASHDSSDVWSHQELFQLDDAGRPKRLSGYPPDRFNSRGQSWGHPQYDWTVHQQNDFYWWVQRFRRLYDLFDAVRIDHFLGFTRTWSIPAKSRDARNGRWVKSPGAKLFNAVEQNLGKRPMIAEDLGHVTPADIRLRKRFGMLPMRIFQFGFSSEPDSADHLPHNYSFLTAAYTGNHDNNTIKGWFSKLPSSQKRLVEDYTCGEPATIHSDCMRSLQGSTASLVIIPLQDILGLGSEARMNIPGTVKGNWNWRLNIQIPSAIIKKLNQQSVLFGRYESKKNQSTKSTL